jgi:hypothetical protein
MATIQLILAVPIGSRLVQSLELHYEDTANAASSTQTDSARISQFISRIAELIPVDVILLALVIIIVLIAIALLVRYCYMQRFSRPQA